LEAADSGPLFLIGYVLLRMKHLPALLGGQVFEFRICFGDQGEFL